MKLHREKVQAGGSNVHIKLIKNAKEKIYQMSAGALTRLRPCKFENASHAHGI